MGCVFSRPEFVRANPRIFQVWNVDGSGRNIKPGKIEVTESQIILYQKGDVTVRWPLRCLRRYGFDAELFSFECGRRCPTGPGVYAFKCRRAEVLFNVLQECIQNSGGGGGSGAGNISIAAIDDQISLATTAVTVNSMISNGTVANGSVAGNHHQSPAVDSSGYLEPITANSHLQCPLSGGSGARSNGGSPGGFVCIHSMGGNGEAVEWSTNGFPSSTSLPSCCSFGACSRATTHNYVNNEVAEQANGGFGNSVCVMHQYVNSSVIAADSSHRCCSPRCHDRTQNTYVNSSVTSPLALSPGHLPCPSGSCTLNCLNCVDVNTNYAKLDDLLKQEQSVKRHKEQQHCYVNVKPEQNGSSTSSKCVSGRSTPTDGLSRSGTVTSPTSSVSKSCSSHFYANVGSPTSIDAVDIPKELVKNITHVNYAVLDLDQSDISNNTIISPVSGTVSGNSLPNSPARTPEGYAQIDFDKTVALSNSAIPCPLNDDSIRKTRHNAVIPSASTPS